MASTYVNDLRLNEMATGDQSGSWGTVTNTNLELIAEAFSYGTEAITTNADTHTTTIADGATDPGRSMFLKYTGTLDSACTITIGPNTVSKLWFIENATSGSQNIIIKQGSGATVTIASGKTKVIYSDGVGSGAKMVDAFASLDVGALTANGGVVVDNITIDGNEIDVGSGILTLDVASDIRLDAGGGNIQLLKGGTEFARFFESSSDFYIYNPIIDKDIKFYGNDGGTSFTALTLDMSAGGNATFSDLIKTGNMSISGQEIDVSSGNLTLDVAGDIILDADGGDIKFKDGGTEIGSISLSGSNVAVISAVQDEDIFFKGNDGGSTIDALTLDMSEAGEATFNDDINLGDSKRLRMGAGGDFEIFHDGSNNYIKGASSDQDIIFQGVDGGSTITAFTLDMSDGGRANFNNDIGLLDGKSVRFGTDNDSAIFHSGSAMTVSNSTGNLTLDVAGDIVLDAADNEIVFTSSGTQIGYVSMASSNLTIESVVSDKDLIFRGNDGGSAITALTLDMSAAGAATFNNDVTAFSDERLKSNITTIPDALSKVTEMRGVHYVRDATGKDSTGVIAQEMQKVAPELVLTAEDEMGTLSVNYGNITGYLIEAIKELKAEIEELKAR